MASYRIEFKRSVAKDLGALPAADIRPILDRIESLSTDPRPAGSERLSEQERCRVRQGSYRIVYEIHDDRVLVVVVKVGQRREVHRAR